MRNKKGFTLSEILVTIAIIALILLIAIPSIMKISTAMKQRTFETKKTSIVAAAELYARRNKDAFGGATQIGIKVRTLIYSGDIEVDADATDEACDESIGCVINPVDNSSMNDEIIVIKRAKSIVQADFGEFSTEESPGFGESSIEELPDSGDTKTYTVYFDENGADQGVVSLACSVSEGETCSVSAPAIARTGWQTYGWGSDSNTKTRLFNSNDPIVLSNTNDGETYYALTYKSLEAYFDRNASSILVSVLPAEMGICDIWNKETSCKITTPTMSRSDGIVDGWSTTRNSHSASLGMGVEISLTQNVTYYGVTHKTIAATFNANGASSIGSSRKECTMWNDDTLCTISSFPSITPASDKFASGWNTNASASSASVAVNSSANISTDTVYYAIQRQAYGCYAANTTYTCKSSLNTQAPYTTDSSAASTACNSIANVTGCSLTSQEGGPYTYTTSGEFCIIGPTGRKNAVSCDSTAAYSVFWRNCSTTVSSTNVWIDVDACDGYVENSTDKYACLKELFRKIMVDTDSTTKTSLCSTEVQAGSSHADSIWLFYSSHTTDKANYFYEQSCKSYKNYSLVGTFGECNLKGFNPVRSGTTNYGYTYYVMSYGQSNCGTGTATASSTCRSYASGKYENGACPSTHPNQVIYGDTSSSC